MAGPISTTIFAVRLDYDTAPDGNVLQTGELPLADNRVGRATKFTLALGFGSSTAEAERAARASLRIPFVVKLPPTTSAGTPISRSLQPAPRFRCPAACATQYNVSVMTIKAHEDKTFPGAFIASLTLPWGFCGERRRGWWRLSLRLGA